MFPDVLADRIRAVLAAAGLPSPDDALRVARPLRSEHGDYSTPVALRLAGATGRDPDKLAELVAAGLRLHDGIEEVTVAAGGHVNVRFTPEELADTARQLATSQPSRLASIPYVQSRPFEAELARLLRGADSLDVPEEPVDPADLAAPDQRRLICQLAETADIAHRKPVMLARHFGEIENSWYRVAAIQPILPKGDENATSHHSSGRLLAAATFRTLAGVEALP